MATPVGSEIVIMDDRILAAHATREMPNIANMNVTNSSKVHVGPKFVSVNQTVQNKEMIKGHILGLELVESKSKRRLRCSVAVFLCWAFLVSSGLAIYLLYLALYKQGTRLDIGLKEPWYLRRLEWQARKAYGEDFMDLPVRFVLIGHSGGNYCNEKYTCIKSMLEVQENFLNRGYDDIGPNFLVGGNGILFEGRGANVVGAMVKSWNLKSISIMFLGDYRYNNTEPDQFEHVNVLLKKLVQNMVITPDFELYGVCQISPYTVSPGLKVVKQLINVTHWNSKNKDLPLPKYIWSLIKNSSKAERLSCVAAITAITIFIFLIVYYTVYVKRNVANVQDIAEWNISREMWLADGFQHNVTTTAFEPLKLVIIQHTVGNECHLFVHCAAELRNLQRYYLKDRGYDIPYNFLIGNDGRVYEGRGWNKVGAHTFGYNSCSLGIGFMGDYREELSVHTSVTQAQLESALRLFQEGVKRGHLDPNFYVVGAKDVQSTESPGSNLYAAIRQWSFYDHKHQFGFSNCTKLFGNRSPNN